MKNNQTLANGATVTIYPTTTEPTNYVVYLHGGGMIYGTKSDLPEELKELFTSNGYTVLALDYLLAPNTKIDHILGTLTETFQLLNEEIIQNQPFGLCGRSAGGYLMLQLTKQLQTLNLTPQFLVNFYGYTDLEFIKEPRKLLKQAISAKEIATIDQTKPVWSMVAISFSLSAVSLQYSASAIAALLRITRKWGLVCLRTVRRNIKNFSTLFQYS